MIQDHVLLLYMVVHLSFGALSGIALMILVEGNRRGRFSILDWCVLVGLLAMIYWFSDYVGDQVRMKTFGSPQRNISVALMISAFALASACWVFIRRRRSGKSDK
jgi:TRAP-type uncharacterized transport system fused permease subunit